MTASIIGRQLVRSVIFLGQLFILARPYLVLHIPIIILLGYQAAGGELSTLSVISLLLLFVMTFPLALIIYGTNDLADTVSDAINKNRANHRIDLADPAMRRRLALVIYVTTVGVLVVAAATKIWPVFVLVAMALCLALAYSLPPWRLKRRPILDMLSSGVCYVPLMYAIGGSLALGNWYMPPVEIWSLGLFAAAFHLLLSIRDITADYTVGDTTTAVWLGKTGSIIVVLVITLFVMIIWYTLRPDDLPAQLFFITQLLAVVAIYFFDTRRMFTSVAVLMVVVAATVGAYKLWW